MKRVMHYLTVISIVVCIFTYSLTNAANQEYPNKPITIVIQFPTGGGGYVANKAIGDELQKLFGQPVIVECKPGAMGTIAGDYVAKAKPDGYVIGVFDSEACIPELYSGSRKTTYTSQDFIPVARYYTTTYGLFSNVDAPWKKLDEFIKHAKEYPNKIRWGHPGVGHQMHLFGIALSKANKLEMIPVPYKGAPDIITNVLGGHIEAGISSVASIRGHIESGRLTLLAIQHGERVAFMPEMPTFKELGYDLGFPPLYKGFFLPKGTPDTVVKKIQNTVKLAIENPSFKALAAKLYIELYYGSAADLINDMQKDREIIGGMLKEIKP